jgi:hypothetical protein
MDAWTRRTGRSPAPHEFEALRYLDGIMRTEMTDREESASDA